LPRMVLEPVVMLLRKAGPAVFEKTVLAAVALVKVAVPWVLRYEVTLLLVFSESQPRY